MILHSDELFVQWNRGAQIVGNVKLIHWGIESILGFFEAIGSDGPDGNVHDQWCRDLHLRINSDIESFEI